MKRKTKSMPKGGTIKKSKGKKPGKKTKIFYKAGKVI